MNSSQKTVSAPKSKNWLLIKFREWHGWGGIIAAIFLLVVGATGIVLNYKKPILSAFGLEESPKEMMGQKEKGEKQAKKMKGEHETILRAETAGSLPITFPRALELAKKQLGDAPLDKIELKDEHGQLIYKVKQLEGDELWIDAQTGDYFVKAEYEKMEMQGGALSMASKTRDWGKIMLDLHTGKIGGDVGKAIMTAVAVVLLLLTVSGIYLWTVPIWRKYQSRKAQASVASVKSSPQRPVTKKAEDLVGV